MYIPGVYVLNKIDQISIEELDLVYKIPHAVPISANQEWNFDELLRMMWEYLDLVRMWVILCHTIMPLIFQIHKTQRAITGLC